MACNYLTVGDRILEIDGIDCYSLTESQAISFLRRPSNCIELLVLKRRGENVVPPKRSSSCKAFQNFAFPKPRTAAAAAAETDTTTPGRLPRFVRGDAAENVAPSAGPRDDDDDDAEPAPPAPAVVDQRLQHGGSDFSNFRPRRSSLQIDGEPVRLRSRSSSPQFWKRDPEAAAVCNGTAAVGGGADCKSFWKKMEKCSMEDLSARGHTPSPVRPASVAFYPKTAESCKTGSVFSPRKKVTSARIIIVNYTKTRSVTACDQSC